LRFVEVAIPGPGGFSPVFFLIILVGYVFGGRLGFLMGALTLLVSALVTGGVGPWLPGQMFTVGWVGMSAPLLRRRPSTGSGGGRRGEIGRLIVFGAAWGLLYGAVMNLWAWPFIAGPADQYWAPGAGLKAALERYLAYYLVTSLAWDLARSAGNVLILSVMGAPTLRALRRFKDRFTFVYIPEAVHAPEAAALPTCPAGGEL
jgi:energy-coupling factor transport system substrate-specific component